VDRQAGTGAALQSTVQAFHTFQGGHWALGPSDDGMFEAIAILDMQGDMALNKAKLIARCDTDRCRFNEQHKTWFYVNTKSNPPASQWTQYVPLSLRARDPAPHREAAISWKINKSDGEACPNLEREPTCQTVNFGSRHR
jgi:hypothetical protein